MRGRYPCWCFSLEVTRARELAAFLRAYALSCEAASEDVREDGCEDFAFMRSDVADAKEVDFARSVCGFLRENGADECEDAAFFLSRRKILVCRSARV